MILYATQKITNQDKTSVKKVLNSKEASLALGISRSALYRLPSADIRKIQITSRRVGWPISEIERFIVERLNRKQK